MENQQEERFCFRRDEAAKYAGVSLPILDKWIRTEGFPVIKVGNRYRIPKKKFEEWLEKQIGEAV